jgi:hypothetical protein
MYHFMYSFIYMRVEIPLGIKQQKFLSLLQIQVVYFFQFCEFIHYKVPTIFVK